MKIRFISFFLFMLAMSCFMACSSDDPAPDPEPEPEPEPVETVNTYTYKDKTVQAKSVSCFEQEGIVYVCMSPLQSLETMEDFMNSGKEYIMLGVDKKLVGTPVTVGNSDNDNYAFYYMDADGEAIVAVSPDGWEDVLTQGKITVTMVPGENETSAVKAVFDFTLKSGGKFTGEADCVYKAPEKLPSEYSFGDEVRPLKSVVATTLGGFQYVYLSPETGLTTVEDISDAEYLMLAITPEMIGQEIDITSSGDAEYAFYNMTNLGKNIKYPTIAQENGTQGRVIIQFVVERDGSITDVRVARGVDPYLDKEAVRVVKSMPKWLPGKQNGKAVRVKFTVPVMFRLQ